MTPKKKDTKQNFKIAKEILLANIKLCQVTFFGYLQHGLSYTMRFKLCFHLILTTYMLGW